MALIHKSWWAALALTAIVGCTNEEATPSATPTSTPGKQVGVMPADDKKGVDKKADAAPTPAPALPPVEGPKVEAPPVTPPSTEVKKPEPLPEGKKEDDKADAGKKLGDDELTEIKKLSPEEQTLALKQLTCPVSDENLGSMGTPIKVVAEGKTFFICCKGCQKEVTKDAKSVVAKLKN